MFRSKALRPIAGVVLITFTALTLQPLTAAAQLPSAPKRAPAQSESGEERFSRTLNEIHEILKEVVPQAAMPHMFRSTAPAVAGKPGEKVLQAVGPKMRLESERAKPRPGVDVTAKVKTLRGKYKELKSLEAEVDKGFKATEKHLRDKNLPPEILARHEAAVTEYEKRKTAFGALMQSVEAAADGKGELQPALASLGEFMAKYPNAKTHTPTDPNNLPWGSPKPVTRAPYTSPAQFKTSRLFGEPVKVAQAGSLSGISLPSTVLPTTPMPADTAPTEDVQITQAIRDLAASLGNKPVPIYNWVRNNIQFIPSYGSIQGSDMTLQTKRGNSFDTASLLIALLRAANVPSRYVYGTIEVPADKAMNWVGGVTVPQAAQNLMGQGGIPNVGIGSGGQIRSIRLEHVWVEAYVDYIPSRGAVNRVPDTWVPLDASFKQYQFTQGMDIKTAVPFDTQSFLTQIKQGATVDEAGGSVQNLNQAAVQDAINDYRTRATSFVSTQGPNVTVGDLLGTQTVAQENRPILLGTLPYKRIATGAKFQAIPDNLRWKFRYNIYANDTDRAFDAPFITLERSAPSVVAKKITLAFAPATPADLTMITSFLPQQHADGSPVQFGEFPRNLPGYLIRVVPELRVEGEIIATGPASTMGTELIQSASVFDPARGWQTDADDRIIAGEHNAVTFIGQGVAPEQTENLRSRLQETRDRLAAFQANPSDPQLLQGISGSSVAGDILFSQVLAFFAACDGTDKVTARANQVVSYRAPSYGRFFASMQPRLFFGIPRTTTLSGGIMDVDRLAVQAQSKNGDAALTANFLRLSGLITSSHEHSVPEFLLKDPNIPGADPQQPVGISAVRALSIAAAQGQRIYTLNEANASQHQSILAQLSIVPDVKSEIADALAVGKQVTVHERDISFGGAVATGYIILDPATGAGAYKVNGGENGAFIVTLIFVALAFIALAFAFAASPVLVGISMIILAFEFVKVMKILQTSDSDTQINQALFLLCLSAIVALIFFPAAVAEVMKLGAELLLLVFGLTWFV